MRAFDRELNRVILELAPAHVARSHAPGTFGELIACPARVVWEGASDATIYGDARVNHAFRAWHDGAHVAGFHGFTLEGERATCERQIAGLLAAYPSAPKSWLALIRAEVIGQAEHFDAFGAFPEDQAAFIRDYVGRIENASR